MYRSLIRQSAIENVGRHAVAIKADSADPSAIRTAVAKAVQQLGTLDVAVVNAGVLRLASVEAFTLEETEVARLVAYLARPEASRTASASRMTRAQRSAKGIRS